VPQASQDLESNGSDCPFIQRVCERLNITEGASIAEFEEEVVVVSSLLFINKVNDVGVPRFLQVSDLASQVFQSMLVSQNSERHLLASEEAP
jgi:hypothetical protein